MFTTEWLKASIASGANTFAQLTSQYNGITPTLNSGFLVPADLNRLMYIAGVGAHLCGLRYQAPSILPFPYPTFYPNNRGTAFESPVRLMDFSANPYILNPSEELDIYATQNSGGAETDYAFIALTDGAFPMPPPGPFLSVHWTATTTLTAGAFTAVQPVFDQALKAGMYALVGSRCYSATGLFHQMLPASGPKNRPGGTMVQTYDGLDPANQRPQNIFSRGLGGWGVWLTFAQNVPPQVNILATSADTAEEGIFDLIYMGA